ncbi:MAG: sodium:proton antiporter [Oscillospiraceae bacterium]|nr:sodium:proton antiporter [Oscillospiraceae bacterium]
MMAWLTLGAFCAGLLLCLLLDAPILYALAFGLALFLLYGRRRGFSWRELAKMTLDGALTVKNILLTFVLIGVLTALWRAAGTIPVIVCYATALIRPSVYLLMTFLLNCGVSVLTGTSFGTGATMGVICATMGVAMGFDLRLIGGAVLSGVYFGDRCSPVSTSALLVAELTHTSIFDNLRGMVRTALVPFLVSCAVFGVLGAMGAHGGSVPDLRAVFARGFVLHWAALLPAVVILLLSALRVNVKLAMLSSIVTAVPLCLVMQRVAPLDMLRIALTGYRAADAELGAMLNGGGITSMLRVGGIVCLSASYSDIFRKTGLLDGAKRAIEALAARSTPYAAMLCTSILGGMLSCNQSLDTILTYQLCLGLKQDDHAYAIDLEDTAIIVAPLIPWSIAGAVPLSAVGAPTSAILFSVYLYLLPLWRLLLSFRSSKKATA